MFQWRRDESARKYRAILLTDSGKLTIFVIVPRIFVEPALWKRTISSMAYNRNDFSLQDFDYRIEKRHKKKKVKVNRRILLGCSFYSYRFWNCFSRSNFWKIGFDIKFIVRFNMELIFGKYEKEIQTSLDCSEYLYSNIVKLISKIWLQLFIAI